MESKNSFLLDEGKRKLFLLSGVCGVCTLICIRFYIIPQFFGIEVTDYINVINSILNNLIAALFSSLAISLFFIYLHSPLTDTSNIIILEPSVLKRRFRECKNTFSYLILKAFNLN